LPIYTFSALAAPGFILTAIKNMQRNFLWQGIKTGRKGALISWDKICKPKLSGGLSLRDPATLNKTLSAKIWWRWLKHPSDLWAHLWNQKYTPHLVEKHLVIWNEQKIGSLMWNASKQHNVFIAEHTFWEV
jgi:hypothetical protein